MKSSSEILFLPVITYGCSYIGRANFAATLPAIIASGFLTRTAAGSVAMTYMASYATGMLITGILATYFSPRLLVTIGLTSAGTMNLLMGLASSPVEQFIFWGINGFSQSLIWPGVLRTFTDYLTPKQRAIVGGHSTMALSTGTLIAFMIPALLLRFVEWRAVFIFIGAILITGGASWFFRFPKAVAAAETPRLEPSANTDVAKKRRTVSPSGKQIVFLTFATGAILIIFPAIINGALRDSVTTWAPLFLSERFGISVANAALTSILIPLISTPGAYLAAWLFNSVIKNELKTCAILFAFSLLFLFALRLLNAGNLNTAGGAVLATLLIASTFFLMQGVNTLLFTYIPFRFSKYGMSAFLSCFFDAWLYLATAITARCYGATAETYGWGTLINIWLIVAAAGVFTSLALSNLRAITGKHKPDARKLQK